VELMMHAFPRNLASQNLASAVIIHLQIADDSLLNISHALDQHICWLFEV
jgi:hypothetical protein